MDNTENVKLKEGTVKCKNLTHPTFTEACFDTLLLLYSLELPIILKIQSFPVSKHRNASTDTPGFKTVLYWEILNDLLRQ